MFGNKKRKSKYRLLWCIIFIVFIIFLYKKVEIKWGNFMGKKTDLGEMPTWNLSDLYKSVNDKQIDIDLQDLARRIANFSSYKNDIDNLDANKLYKALEEYENIQELQSKLGSFAYLKYAEDLSKDENVKFYQKITEELTKLSSNLIFFDLEVNKLDQSKLDRYYRESKSLAVYKQVITDMRTMKPHQLNEQLEKLFLEKSISGRNAWSRLFDETIDNMVFEYKGKKYNESQMLEMMSGKDADIRKETSKIFGETLGKNAKLFAYITNTLAKDKETNDTWHKFKTPISSRNLSNLIEDDVVEKLRETVKSNYKDTAHRYYKWKAKQFGVKKLHYSDRNAPLPFADDTVYKWEDAVKIVREAYEDFSPEMLAIGDEFFNNNWIDVPTKQGKRGGAFMSPTTPKVHPYILLNYTGRTRDVMTLAHELGHGIHQNLADKNGFFMSQTPLTLAETASVFGEQLTFRKLLKNATGKNKKAILASKIEDMLNTVVRQIAFLEFETKVHNERRNGELSLDRINEIWMDVQKESLGENNFIWDDEYKYYWTYIPHFIHSPFYVYSYAFGDCLVNSLYGIYQINPSNFKDKYIDLLSAGSSKRYTELLKPFGLNPKDSDFWQKGVDVLIRMISELENME